MALRVQEAQTGRSSNGGDKAGKRGGNSAGDDNDDASSALSGAYAQLLSTAGVRFTFVGIQPPHQLSRAVAAAVAMGEAAV